MEYLALLLPLHCTEVNSHLDPFVNFADPLFGHVSNKIVFLNSTLQGFLISAKYKSDVSVSGRSTIPIFTELNNNNEATGYRIP
jgi:hypothetical protein